MVISPPDALRIAYNTGLQSWFSTYLRRQSGKSFGGQMGITTKAVLLILYDTRRLIVIRCYQGLAIRISNAHWSVCWAMAAQARHTGAGLKLPRASRKSRHAFTQVVSTLRICAEGLTGWLGKWIYRKWTLKTAAGLKSIAGIRSALGGECGC